MASATNISFDGDNFGTQVGINNGKIAVSVAPPSEQEIDRICIRALRCPNSRAVRNRLTQTKDQIRHHLVDWVLKSPQYTSWHDGDDICLLWIKGGAGKGKTMMTLSLISRLSQPRDDPPIIIYFFCQNADYELNNIVAIIKGLILQLIYQQEMTKECLRSRWDAAQKRFTEDLNSWRNLWRIFWEMIDQCRNARIFIVVDALDECVDDDMAEFLRLIVRNGLDQPGRIKWLLTSRPLDIAEMELLTGRDQVQVSLELNSASVSEAVQEYVIEKVNELDRRVKYGDVLRRRIESELLEKADGGFLWVSLVCKELEGVHKDDALSTIAGVPPGLPSFYVRALEQVCIGDDSDVQKCFRLLHVMKLAYRPLRLGEFRAVSAMVIDLDDLKRIADRCASFLRVRADTLEFVHQSAREFLRGNTGPYDSPLDNHPFRHLNIALSCLSYLRRRLKANLLDLSRPDSTANFLATLKCEERQALLSEVEYGATFWVQHLGDSDKYQATPIDPTTENAIKTFLEERLLEWLECLSWLGRLSEGVGSLRALGRLAKGQTSFSPLSEDATRLLLRHYNTIVKWPLQIYSSAIVFSPKSSLIRERNQDRISKWLMRFPLMEDDWSPLIQTLNGHYGDPIHSVAFSSDGAYIMSGSEGGQIHLWDTITGELQETIHPYSSPLRLCAVAFSPDSKQIAAAFTLAGSTWSRYESTTPWNQPQAGNFVRIFNTSGQLLHTDLPHSHYVSHSHYICAVVFSPDGKQVASRSTNDIIMLWDTQTCQLRKMMPSDPHARWKGGGHLQLAYSADGRRIAANIGTIIKIWDLVTGELECTLTSKDDRKTFQLDIMSMTFLPDNRIAILYCGHDKIEIWDLATRDIDEEIDGNPNSVLVEFSSDGTQIASTDKNNTIHTWDWKTNECRKSFEGHSNRIASIAISPDGQQIASGSLDGTIKLWNTAAKQVQGSLTKHKDWVTTVAISPDGRRIASGSMDQTIKIWNVKTSSLEKTISHHPTRKLGTIWHIVFSPNSKLIACDIGVRAITFLDPEAGSFPITLKIRDYFGYHPDDLLQLCKDDRNEPQMYRLKAIAAGEGSHIPMAFSPDSEHIVSGDVDGNIKLWNLANGIVQKELLGHSKPITAVSFSSDGMMIASGSKDTTVKLWDAQTGNLLRSLAGHMDPITTLAFSPDGTSLASSDGNTLKTWTVSNCLRASEYIGRALSSLIKFRSSSLNFTTTHRIYSMRFLSGNQYLSTNAGLAPLVKLSDKTDDNDSEDIGLEVLQDIRLMGYWICYGVMPCLLLPADFQPECYDVQGDLITIGLRNGRVLNFSLDRKVLHSLLERWTSGVLTGSTGSLDTL